MGEAGESMGRIDAMLDWLDYAQGALPWRGALVVRALRRGLAKLLRRQVVRP